MKATVILTALVSLFASFGALQAATIDNPAYMISKTSPEQKAIGADFLAQQSECEKNVSQAAIQRVQEAMQDSGFKITNVTSDRFSAPIDILEKTHFLSTIKGANVYLPLNSGQGHYANLLKQTISSHQFEVTFLSDAGIENKGLVSYKVWSFINFAGKPAELKYDNAQNLLNPSDENVCGRFLFSETFATDVELVVLGSSTAQSRYIKLKSDFSPSLANNLECTVRSNSFDEIIKGYQAGKVLEIPSPDAEIGVPIIFEKVCQMPNYSFLKKTGYKETIFPSVSE